MYKFSPSSLSLLKECPRCFWLHFNKNVRRPADIFPSLPSGMDRILKIYFDSFRDKGLLPQELASLNGKYTLFNDVELLNEWRNNFKGLKEDTAGHYKDQMNIYNFLLRKNGYKTENYAYLLFYHPNKADENGVVLFNTDLIKMKVSVKDAEKLFKKALKVLQSDIPDSSEECGFCEWGKVNANL